MHYIDSHVHVWTDTFDRYPLDPGTKVEEMGIRRFLPNQILAHAKRSGVDRIVLVQMSYYGTDNRYMLDVIQSAPHTFRGIAVVDPMSPGQVQRMRRLKAQGVRGFRIVIANNASIGWLREGRFNRMFQAGAEEGLVICALINPEALPALARVCQHYPHTPTCVDHLGRIGMLDPIREEQVQALCSLARYPGVRVKVSAFYALGQKRAPHLDLAELIRQVYDSFGPQRLMWGSDCPFQILEEPYEDSIALIRDYLDFLTIEDKEWLLRRSAEELFFS